MVVGAKRTALDDVKLDASRRKRWTERTIEGDDSSPFATILGREK
jgi:hypothetical protein